MQDFLVIISPLSLKKIIHSKIFQLYCETFFISRKSCSHPGRAYVEEIPGEDCTDGTLLFLLMHNTPPFLGFLKQGIPVKTPDLPTFLPPQQKFFFCNPSCCILEEVNNFQNVNYLILVIYT
jgi:hypothetical protein